MFAGLGSLARLLVEMRDRIKDAVPAGAGKTLSTRSAGALNEAHEALVALGYKPADATRLLKSVEAEDLPTEEIIRAALQGSVRKR